MMNVSRRAGGPVPAPASTTLTPNWSISPVAPVGSLTGWGGGFGNIPKRGNLVWNIFKHSVMIWGFITMDTLTWRDNIN